MQGDPLQFTHIARCRTISGRITRFEIKENIMRHLTMLIRLAIFAESYRYYISNLYVRLLLHLAPQRLYQRFLAKLHATARNVPRVRVRPHTLRRFAHEHLAVKLGGSAALTQSRIKASERSFSAVAANGDTHRKEFGYGKRKRLKFRYDEFLPLESILGGRKCHIPNLDGMRRKIIERMKRRGEEIHRFPCFFIEPLA